MQHIHILGICGTFMGGLAVIARQLGFKVSGSDQQVYPPMSDTLKAAGIEITTGYDIEQLTPAPDLVIIGNALSRGNPAVEYTLNQNIPYQSGAQWLFGSVLYARHVLAVAGTHGKTTTTSILTWLLQAAGLNPGYLIGGVANNFASTANLGQSAYFVIEADEYDTAFFDKRSKFIHYHPRTLILNNLEFDHGDIFPNLAAIQRQCQYLLRTVPGDGLVIHPAHDRHVAKVLKAGCWSETTTVVGAGADWQAHALTKDASQFKVYYQGDYQATVNWSMIGQHNMANALAALAAAKHIGIDTAKACAALSDFQGIKRRLQVRGTVDGITVYDDFAHHPTAIAKTLQALRAKVGSARIFAVLELASNTMKRGLHTVSDLAKSWSDADQILILRPEVQNWACDELSQCSTIPCTLYDTPHAIIASLVPKLDSGDHVLIMSNKGFAGIHQALLNALVANRETIR